MEVGTAPEDVVRTMVAEDHRPAGAIHIVKERHAGEDAAYAVAFEDRDGVQRRGIVGLRRLEGGVWSPSGSFMSSVRVSGHRDIWMTWGGWGSGDASKRAGFGGWVADAAAVSARVTDVTGRMMEDEVENGVVVFLYSGDFRLPDARVDLLDADGAVIRSGGTRKSH
jgi:hypothetical protein